MIHVSGVCFLFFQRSTTAAFGKSESLTRLLSRVVDITRGCVEATPPALSFDMGHMGLMRRLRYDRMALFGSTGYRTPARCYVKSWPQRSHERFRIETKNLTWYVCACVSFHVMEEEKDGPQRFRPTPKR